MAFFSIVYNWIDKIECLPNADAIQMEVIPNYSKSVVVLFNIPNEGNINLYRVRTSKKD